MTRSSVLVAKQARKVDHVRVRPPGPLRAAVRVGREQFEPPATI
jgi:hypothetical protein